jgi:hypothetical protein
VLPAWSVAVPWAWLVFMIVVTPFLLVVNVVIDFSCPSRGSWFRPAGSGTSPT